MESKIETRVLDELRYSILETSMETFMKSKGLWQYTKFVIPNLSNASSKFVVDGNKDEVVGVIRTYIS